MCKAFEVAFLNVTTGTSILLARLASAFFSPRWQYPATIPTRNPAARAIASDDDIAFVRRAVAVTMARR